MPSIVCGSFRTMCISDEGNLYSFGFSGNHAHGHEEDHVFPPKIIPTLNNIQSIAIGETHSVALNNNGNVFTFGCNRYGALGISVGEDILEFTHLPQKVNLPLCKQIACGDNFTICLTNEGLAYSFGYNNDGQLGIGNIERSYSSPQIIASLKDIEFIECGVKHVFCKTLNNEIYCWGGNASGNLGIGNTDNQNTPILCSSLPYEIIVDIKCGYNYTLILTVNGNLFSCGNNKDCQLGRNTNGDFSSIFEKLEEFSEIIRIECGDSHSMCLDSNHDFYVFGDNAFGQLGLGDYPDSFTPIKHPLSNIIDISSGGNHSFVKTSKSEIYAFGKNDYLQLGINHRKVLTPIRVFEDNEDIWISNINKSKQKSARF